MNEYKEVPNIISTKDLMYLQDMFNWNISAYKNTYEAIEYVEDNKLVKYLENALNEFDDLLNEILDIIKGGENENSK